MRNIGLRQLINEAPSESEIEFLLRAGKQFKYASPKTTRQWTRTAENRRTALAEVAGRPEQLRMPVRKNSTTNT